VIRTCPVLVVDDEETLRDSVSQVLTREGFAVKTAASGSEGLAVFGDGVFSLVLLDLRLPDMDGLAVLRRMKEASPETPVVIITGYASIESAVEAVKQGAFDYLSKPFSPDELRVAARKAADNRTLRLENIRLRREMRPSREFEPIIGAGKSLRGVIDRIARAGPTDSAVLISGESGTGKDLVAREIHARSRRREAPFVVLDCGGLDEPGLGGELFGYAPESGFGPPEGRHGRFELADGGTLLIKEVSRLSSRLQNDLLRFLETGEVFRAGSARPISADVRLIAASSVNLSQAVSRGAFRDDLFNRLNVVPIHLPPLRERKEDIPPLVEHFLKMHSAKAGKAVASVSTRAMIVLAEYDWPGNIRELDNTIERAVVLAKGGRIEIEDLMSHGISLGIPALAWAGGQFRPLDELEKEYIQAVLRDQNGNKGRTAAILGIDRKTLWAKIKKYGLERRESS